MNIKKEFIVVGVTGARTINAPFQITLEGVLHSYQSYGQIEESTLALDAKTCILHSIPMSLDLVGRTLVCTFESRELPLSGGGAVNKNSVGSDDVEVRALKKIETITPVFPAAPLSAHSGVSRTCELLSPGGGRDFHRPFYKFILELTEEEYDACKQLPTASVFKVSFRLA